MSYVVWHPGTGTIVYADDACLVDIDDLPECVDDWEDYLETYGSSIYKITPGKEML